jgi:hypothetical protein
MSSINFTIQNLDATLAEIKAYPQDAERIITNEFKIFGQNVANDAKRNAPVDEGRLREMIFSEAFPMEVSIIAGVDYAAYVEFGTKAFAAEYVASLPQDWQTYAATFKGGGGKGSFQQFFDAILRWVERKGIASTFSVKTRQKSQSSASKNNEKQAAYAIAMHILKYGIHPQPYLYPAFEKNKAELIENLKKGLNAKS